MLRLTERCADAGALDRVLRLPFEVRQKSRFRARLVDGTEVGAFLPRGEVLRHGDCLRAASGERVRVEAAPESVSTVRAEDPHLLARICYHLGNRHVPLQIEYGTLRYRHDHVLDAMVRGLGATVAVEEAPFEPEPGAYGGGHGHGHDH